MIHRDTQCCDARSLTNAFRPHNGNTNYHLKSGDKRRMFFLCVARDILAYFLAHHIITSHRPHTRRQIVGWVGSAFSLWKKDQNPRDDTKTATLLSINPRNFYFVVIGDSLFSTSRPIVEKSRTHPSTQQQEVQPLIQFTTNKTTACFESPWQLQLQFCCIFGLDKFVSL